MVNVVAIDGPVGVGKSTVARRVAGELGFRHLDTGAMYRAVAWRALQLSPLDRNTDTIAGIARSMRLDLADDGRVLADGVDITADIRSEEVSRNVHLAADNRAVRAAMVDEQRRLGGERPSVLEGRDITTIVFPNARWKFYLDAAPEVRVQRRAVQLRAMGTPVAHDEIFRNLVDRDTRDRNREGGALTIAGDATLVDTTGLDEDTVVRLICALVRGGERFA